MANSPGTRGTVGYEGRGSGPGGSTIESTEGPRTVGYEQGLPLTQAPAPVVPVVPVGARASAGMGFDRTIAAGASPVAPSAVPAAAARPQAFDATLVAGSSPSTSPPSTSPPSTSPPAAGSSAHPALARTEVGDISMLATMSPGSPSSPGSLGSPASLGASGASSASGMPVGGPITAPRSLTQSVSRSSTVLPRVEMNGTEPQLVHTERNRYEEVKQLGEGGVGEVLLARDHDIDRPVALKRLKVDMRAAGNVIRFVEEVRTIGSLEHPNIVPIHDVGVDAQGQFFFVMKYVKGETLEHIIERLAAGDPVYHERYPFEMRIQLFVGILQAMHYAHAQGVIHRDLKPANVMVGPFGEVMVMDWGLAKRIRDTRDTKGPALPDQVGASAEAPEPTTAAASRERLFQTRHGTLLGTPAYMSPEQARAQELDERSDIYSLGVILLELLSTKHYLASKTTLADLLTGITTEPYNPLKLRADPYAGGFPSPYIYVVMRALAKNPADRHATIADMLHEVKDAMVGRNAIHCHVTLLKRSVNVFSRFMDTNPHVTYALLLAVIGFAGFGVVQTVMRLVS